VIIKHTIIFDYKFIEIGGYLMFNIGDKIVYPIHGAGVIESIEEKEILGSKNKYYIMKMPIGNMSVMIPLDNIEALGIRTVIDKTLTDNVLEILVQSPTEMSKVWTKRYRENEKKIKNGNILDIAEIVRNLIILDRAKKLSAGEKKILSNAKKILLSELMLVLELESQEAEDLLESTVKY
jgi:CarD family transcriptional regulator